MTFFKYFSVFSWWFILEAATALLSAQSPSPVVGRSPFYSQKILRIDFSINATNTRTFEPKITLRRVGSEDVKNTLNSDVMDMGDFRLVLSRKNGNVLFVKGFSSSFNEWVPLQRQKRNAHLPTFEHTIHTSFPKGNFYVNIQQRTSLGDFITIYTQLVTHIPPLPHSQATMSFLNVGTHDRCVNLAIVSEAYAEDDMISFVADASRLVEQLFLAPPFSSYRDRFNIFLVENPSTPDSSLVIDNFFGIKRYVGVKSVWKLEDLLSGIPHDGAIVLEKSQEYKGAGIFNDYCVIPAQNDASALLLQHEFGHYMFGLADEYVDEESHFSHFYDTICEPWEVNITKNFKDPKWGADTTNPRLGVYEGGGYKAKGIYRPYPVCTMGSSEQEPFCLVCERHIRDVLDSLLED